MSSSTEDFSNAALLQDPMYLLGYKNPDLASAINRVFESKNSYFTEAHGYTEALDRPVSYELSGGEDVILPLIALAEALGLRIRIVIDDAVDDGNNRVTAEIPRR